MNDDQRDRSQQPDPEAAARRWTRAAPSSSGATTHRDATSRSALESRIAAELRSEVATVLSEHAPPPSESGIEDARVEWATTLIDGALDRQAQSSMAGGGPVLDAEAERRVRQLVLDSLFGLGGLQRWLDDPSVENININGADRVFIRYTDGTRAQVAPVAATDEELIDLVRMIAARTGLEERRFDRGAPGVSINLADGSRLFAVMAVTGRPCVSIRRHPYLHVTLADLVALGEMDQHLAAQLAALVKARKNILIAGGTGSGKTTLLRALAAEIDPSERLITIEDTLELGLDSDPERHPDVVPLQARDANIEGAGAIELAELVRWALRMSPDRVVVGEVRGAELIPMLNAMSQGNDGSLSTIHSSASAGVFTKLAAYAAQSPERLTLEATNLLVAAAVHVVVHLGTTPDGTRVISSVREIIDADGAHVVSNEVYVPGPDHRAVANVPWRTSTMEDMLAAGLDQMLAHGSGNGVGQGRAGNGRWVP